MKLYSKRRNTFLILLFLVPMLYGCDAYIGPGVYDYGYEMSGGYQLFKNGAQDTTIYISVCDSTGKQVIGNRIIGIAWDDKFILASQKYSDKICYWIIKVETNDVIGPLNESEFEMKRTELKVDSSLKLEDPEKYKYLDPSISRMHQ